MNQPSQTPDSPRRSLTGVLFAYGFRTFFILAGLWAMLAMGVWLGYLKGVWQPELFLNPIWWHGHEMLIGFVGAAAAGFLLTASPNWTKQPPLTGRPLMGMVVLWFLGRCAIGFSAFLPVWLVSLVDMAFPIALLMVVAPPLWTTGMMGHRVFPILLGVLFTGDLLIHLEALGLTDETAYRGLYLGVDAMVAFLVMVGGHIMPMFTKSSFQEHGIDVQFKTPALIEYTAMAAMLPVLIGDVVVMDHPVFGWILIVVGGLQALRLATWHSFKTLNTPLLWVLHLGYLWIVMGLLLRGGAIIFDWMPQSTAIHALTVGAMGLFTAGIMSRIALLHTGRTLKHSGWVTLFFLLLPLAALLRIGFPELPGDLNILLSGLFWIIGYGIFLVYFSPMLVKPRADGQPG
ncbi:MAG: NnrS family protein [Magnetococcales bacterium]|nr:NnrS family protein [Magnetococcales bacterium]